MSETWSTFFNSSSPLLNPSQLILIVSIGHFYADSHSTKETECNHPTAIYRKPQSTQELRTIMATEITAPKPDLVAKAKKTSNFEAGFNGIDRGKKEHVPKTNHRNVVKITPMRFTTPSSIRPENYTVAASSNVDSIVKLNCKPPISEVTKKTQSLVMFGVPHIQIFSWLLFDCDLPTFLPPNLF